MAKKRRFDFTKKNKRSGKVENVGYLDLEQDEEQRDRKSTRLNSSHRLESRMPSSA